ncbi:MAG: LacI family DNA-binding transcriptional regulator [Bacteroidales bacterium]|nr:LacI family DNA-binding transcriptional regulator [Bacteroidales bacterium]
MKKHATIKDIARELDISTSTVSRALSDRYDVNPGTKTLVLETAKRMNYHPNPMAVGLIKRKSNTIGLVVPELLNAFFPTIIHGIQPIINQCGYHLLITDSNESAEMEANNLRLLENNMVEGILISTTADNNQNYPLYQELINSGIPMVFFNRVCNEVSAPKIIICDRKMSFFAVEHLIYSHYKKIAHLAGPPDLVLSKERKGGYIDALTKHHIPVDEHIIKTAGIFIDDGFEAMNNLLDTGQDIDAIFAFNDPVAIGAMRAIKKRGLKIPEDIAVVGFSESSLAQIVEPNLTSVAQPLKVIGQTAAELILKLIRGEHVDNTIIELEAKLNVRDSSLKK